MRQHRYIRALIALIIALGGLVGVQAVLAGGASATPPCGTYADYFDNATQRTTDQQGFYGLSATMKIPGKDLLCTSSNKLVYGGAFIALQSRPTGGVLKIGFQYSVDQGCNEWFVETKKSQNDVDYKYIKGPGYCISDNEQHVVWIQYVAAEHDWRLNVDGSIIFTSWFDIDSTWIQPIIRIGGEVSNLASNMPGYGSGPTSITNITTQNNINNDTLYTSILTTGIHMDAGPNSNPSKWDYIKVDDANWGFKTKVVQ